MNSRRKHRIPVGSVSVKGVTVRTGADETDEDVEVKNASFAHQEGMGGVGTRDESQNRDLTPTPHVNRAIAAE